MHNTIAYIYKVKKSMRSRHTYIYLLLDLSSCRSIYIGIPLRPIQQEIKNRSFSIPISWKHYNTCFEEHVFFFNMSWYSEDKTEKGCSSIVIKQQTANYTIENVQPNKTYTITILAVSEQNLSIYSEELKITISTLGMLCKIA